MKTLLAATISLALLTSAVRAITVDGSLDSAYGSPLAIQTVNTGFGNATGGDGSGGSELDAGYGVIQGGTLYLFLAGVFENNGNHANIFIDGGAAGQSTLSAPTTATLATMNGSVFSPGFHATYAYDMNDFSGTLYNEEYTYAGPSMLSGGYVGSVAETSTGIGSGIPSGGSFAAYATLGLNNTHVSTMGAAGTAADQGQAAGVTTGLELAVPLSVIGYTGGSIKVLADINGGGDSYLSNQFLPGLAVGTANLGASTFNFGSTSGEYFVVAVPEPSTLSLLGLAALAAVFRVRKR
jgi:hypothetical protein